METQSSRLKTDYPWFKAPLIAGAPMRLIASAQLAVEISKAGGVGFIGAGSDVSTLEASLKDAKGLLSGHGLSTRDETLPIGVGFINWGADRGVAIPLIREYRPAAVWFFAPRQSEDLGAWSEETRKATDSATKIWVQIGTVAEALQVLDVCKPDVLVVQGGDAGGHGLTHSASIVALLPEVQDALADRFKGREAEAPTLIAAGGIADGRGVAAALALGASGAVLGTRYLAATEANIAQGYRDEVIRASDGGPNTVRSSVYDFLRGTTEWPKQYGGRGVINQSYVDAQAGMDESENRTRYEEAMKAGDAGWGPKQRMTTYAGTAVGLVKREQRAGEITIEVRDQAIQVMQRVQSWYL